MTGVTGAEVVAVALADFDDDVAVELIPDSVLTIFLLLSLMMPQLSLQHDGLSSHTFTRGKNPVPVAADQSAFLKTKTMEGAHTISANL